MSLTVLLILLALALADSTSIGTLVIPIWFLLGAKLHSGKYLLYTGTVALFYFCVGLVGLAGAVPALQALGNLPTTLPFLWTELFAGIALIVLAFRLDPKRRAHPAKESRIQRWHRLILTGKLSNKSIMRMGLAATSLELVTMVPYIAAIVLLSTQPIPWSHRISGLAGYVVIMMAPALLLLGIRYAIHRRVAARLERFNAWIITNADDITSWTVGIAGSAIATDAIVRLLIALATG